MNSEDKGPCDIKNGGCGHAFAEHAPDMNYPNSQRCFHGAGDGTGCRDKYDTRCKNYVPPTK